MKHKIKGGEARSAEHGREHGDVGRRAHPAHARKLLNFCALWHIPRSETGAPQGAKARLAETPTTGRELIPQDVRKVERWWWASHAATGVRPAMEGRCFARHERQGGSSQCEERIWQGRRGCWWRVLEWAGILGSGRCGVSPLEGVAPHEVSAGGRLSPPTMIE